MMRQCGIESATFFQKGNTRPAQHAHEERRHGFVQSQPLLQYDAGVTDEEDEKNENRQDVSIKNEKLKIKNAERQCQLKIKNIYFIF
jgi:hypothetical protein